MSHNSRILCSLQHRDFNAGTARDGTRTRQRSSPLAAPRAAHDADNAMNGSPNPHRIKGANLTGAALKSALASKISPFTPQEISSNARKKLKHALHLRRLHNAHHDHTCLSLDRRGVIYLIFTTVGPFESYVGQTVDSCFDRFRSHIQEATGYHASSVYTPGEGRGLYLYMQHHGLHNLAILPLQTGFYPQDETINGHVVFQHNTAEFKTAAAPIEHKWRVIYDAQWNVMTTKPRDSQAGPDATRKAWKRRLENTRNTRPVRRPRTDRLPRERENITHI